MKPQNIIFSSAITALLIITVLITPPLILGGVPFSLQPLIIAIIALTFDWKTTCTIISLYILIGFLGIPVFSGGKNGLATLASGTSGFVIGFIPYALFLSLSQQFSKNKSTLLRVSLLVCSALFSLIILYICGFISLHLALNFSIPHFLSIMSFLFIVDIIKLLIAIGLACHIQPYVLKFQNRYS